MIVKEIFSLIGRKRKNQALALLPAMAFASLLEMVGLAMVMTICSLIVSGEMQNGGALAQWFMGFFPSALENGSIASLILCLIALYVFKLVYLAWENYTVAKFVRMTRNDMTTRLYARVLRCPYSFFLRHTTAEIQNMLVRDMSLLSNGLSACMQMMMEALVAACMGAYLTLVNPTMTAFVAGSLAALLVVTRVLLSRPIRDTSARQRAASRNRFKWVQYTAEGIKDIKTGRREAFFEAHFAKASAEFARSDYLQQFFTQLPYLCIEAVMVISVLVYILFLTLRGDVLISSLPGLAALAWTAVRLLPACGRINTALTQIGYSKASVKAIEAAFLETEEPAHSARDKREVALDMGIALRGVSFSYEDRADDVVRDVNLEIPAGCAVGIVGMSGAGKTTLLDILLGLNAPTEGTVEIDGVALKECIDSYWEKLAYVSQTTFLLDDTIRSNVAMGVDQNEIDDVRIWTALKKAALADVVKALPRGLDTQIGERGVTLSGGERQRLGLARAMYFNPKVIVFDEATSALDAQTEAEILRVIGQLKGEKTLVIVSHRPSVLSICDRVYCVKKGSVFQEEHRAS